MLRIAYSSAGVVKPKKLTRKEQLHFDAVASMANCRIVNRARALKKFAKEIKEVEELERQLDAL